MESYDIGRKAIFPGLYCAEAQMGTVDFRQSLGKTMHQFVYGAIN